jgi:hypothetical protein
VFRDGATTAGMHELAIVMLAAAAVLLVLTLVDRSLARLVQRVDASDPRDLATPCPVDRSVGG